MATYAAFAVAEPAGFQPGQDGDLSKIYILDGSYVMNVGDLRVNITNFGLIGSQYSGGYVYSDAPSGEWPGGSGNEYLWGAGLWIGGRLGGSISVTTGQTDKELRPADRVLDTIYEARSGIVRRPYEAAKATGMRRPAAHADDDGDGRYDEDMLNGIDDDGDGRVDEDFGQLGDQMFTCTMFDNLPLIREIYPEHEPLGLKVVQRSIAWDRERRSNIVALDYEITNVGYDEIHDAYLGFYVDCDIQARAAGANQPDDLAGSYSGIVRGEDGYFYRAEFGYMLDGAEENPLPGIFAVAVLNHKTAFDGVTAPFRPGIHSFNIFATTASVNQDGEPKSDNDRYYVMSREHRDRDMRPDEAADLKFLISSGPFEPFEKGETLEYQIALMAGLDMTEILETVAEAGRLYAGRWYDDDHDYGTGVVSRETKVCLGDYPTPRYGDDPILGHRLDFMDDSCTGGFPVMFRDIVHPENLIPEADGRLCVWVNMDNCTECMRTMGRECDSTDFFNFLGRYSVYRSYYRYTGTYGRETHYPWSVAIESPPLLPNARVVAGDDQVEVFWDDLSEWVTDPFTGAVDFESYRIWRVQDWVPPGDMDQDAAPPLERWGMIAEFDLENIVYADTDTAEVRPLPLGRNTGLDDIVYEPDCLDDPRFAGVAEAMQTLVDSDPYYLWVTRPPVRRADGVIPDYMQPFARWEAYPAVLDTFWAVTEREADPSQGVIAKQPTRYYHYVDTETHNGFASYYSVTARDHTVEWTGSEYVATGFGIEEDPGNTWFRIRPRPNAQTVQERAAEGANIYVYPNPATREALAEFQPRDPSAQDPTGVRIMFNNLPAAHNTIRIFTASGDLLETIYHDGTTGSGSTSWNLMTRNGQEIVSGIYLYSVHSDDEGFEPFRGRFVVIR